MFDYVFMCMCFRNYAQMSIDEFAELGLSGSSSDDETHAPVLKTKVKKSKSDKKAKKLTKVDKDSAPMNDEKKKKILKPEKLKNKKKSKLVQEDSDPEVEEKQKTATKKK